MKYGGLWMGSVHYASKKNIPPKKYTARKICGHNKNAAKILPPQENMPPLKSVPSLNFMPSEADFVQHEVELHEAERVVHSELGTFGIFLFFH